MVEHSEEGWLREGVSSWNKRRKRIEFSPELQRLSFHAFLPPDYRDDPKSSRYFEKIDLSYADLRGADLSNLNFANGKFQGANLSLANMEGSNFSNADFTGAVLSGAKTERALFSNAKFIRSQISPAQLLKSELSGATLVAIGATPEEGGRLERRGAIIFATENEFKTSRRIGPDTIRAANAREAIYARVITLADSDERPEPEIDVIGNKKPERTPKNKYDVFYCTNRHPVTRRGEVIDFDGHHGSSLSYGLCEVIIPHRRRIGSLGSPLWKRLLNRHDDRLKLDSIITLNEALFWKFINDSRAAMRTLSDPTIFVHGFNNSFRDAVVRAAQIGYDLGMGQGIGLFSWPSKGKFYSYSSDEAVAEAGKYDLAKFLELFLAESGYQSVNIVAHSMGCRCALGALEVLSSQRKSILRRIKHLILAAADVDVKIMPHLARHSVGKCRRTTSYVSDKDKALRLSGWLHQFPRVGVTPPTFILSGMDTILVNDLDLGDFSHGYVGASRTILSDIYQLIKHNHEPKSRHGMEEVWENDRQYWRIRN